jgi:hypothetical protein
MKRVSFTLSVVVFVFFAACKKSSATSNPAPATDSSLILGKWSLVSDVECWYSPNGAFSDSSHFPISSQDVYDFEKGTVYATLLHSSGLATDTSTYTIINNQYIATYNANNGYDTAMLKISHDTMTLTSISYNTVDVNGNPATGYDTAVLIKN